MAKDGDFILDGEIYDLYDGMAILRYSSRAFPDEDVLIVVMGSNPSASSTPKMPEALKLKRLIPNAKITGLHPMATGEADVNIPPPEELVEIKGTKWELLPMDKYRAHNWHCLHDLDNRDKYAVLYTSYGCPFGCDFCNIHALYKSRKVYYRTPLSVMGEIDYLVRDYGIRNLKLCDELFTLNKKHVSDMCKILKDYHLNIWAYARVGTVNPDMLREMKEAGVNWLCYGIESASEDVRNGISKKYGDIFETIRMTKEAGINVLGNFMFGLPNDTLETMEETLKLSQDLECEYVNFYRCMPYPGSKLYEGKNKKWETYNQYYPEVSLVAEFRNMAFKRFFSDKKYLKMIESKFGKKARNHIEDMVV